MLDFPDMNMLIKVKHNKIQLSSNIANNEYTCDIQRVPNCEQPSPNQFTPLHSLITVELDTRRTAAIIDGDDTTTLHCSIVLTCDAFKNSYFYRTMLIWNKLPLTVRQASGISSFKTKLIEYLWSADREWPD